MRAAKKPPSVPQKAKKPSWKFTSTLRARAFGWRSSKLAAQRLREAVKEVKQAAKQDPQRAADGAVLIISKLEPAFEQVDSSSGALGNAVNKALDTLAPIIAGGADVPKAHRKRLDKLFEALQDAGMGYLDTLGDQWGDMCADPDIAAEWADDLAPTLARVWSEPDYAYFSGTSACLSALLAAGRYQQILDLLALKTRPPIWPWRKFGVLALEKMGRLEEALALARSDTLNDGAAPDLACEALLIAMGREEEAYREYGLHLRRAATYKASFAALCKRYPHRAPGHILRDLVHASADPGAWFAAAVSIGELEVAADIAPLARDPRTLTRAAAAHLDKHPVFAFQVAMAALEGIEHGDGYDITSADVVAAYDVLRRAADRLGKQPMLETWRAHRPEGSFVRRVLAGRP